MVEEAGASKGKAIDFVKGYNHYENYGFDVSVKDFIK